MIYQFLSDADIHALIREEFKNGMTTPGSSGESPETFIRKAEAAAIRQIKNKLRDRYNVNSIFAIPKPWSAETPYVAQDRCSHADRFYITSQNTVAQEPTTQNAPWIEDDPRDAYLVTICTDLMLYHLHARHNPRMISEFRILRKDDAIAWLDQVMAGHENPDLPLLKESAPEDLPYGFDSKPRSHYY